MSESEEVSAFVTAAREFCDWLDGPAAEPETERYTVLVLLAKLYAQGLRLPEVDTESLPAHSHRQKDLDDSAARRIMYRLDAFPTRAYWRLNGCAESAEKESDDIARDLYMIYAAVKSSLNEFDESAALRGWSVWSWRYRFWLDWGRHASHAIATLHQHFHAAANE